MRVKNKISHKYVLKLRFETSCEERTWLEKEVSWASLSQRGNLCTPVDGEGS